MSTFKNILNVKYLTEGGYFRANASPKESAKLVNDWVKIATQGKVSKLFGEVAQNVTFTRFPTFVCDLRGN